MKILVAEDEPAVRRSLVRMLHVLGYNDIREAGDGSEALSLIQQSFPELILADIKMPGVDGLELFARAALLSDKIQCIYISGFDYFEYAQKAISLGASGYLLKPVKDTELKSLLDKITMKINQSLKAFAAKPDADDSADVASRGQDADKAIVTDTAGKEIILSTASANNLLHFFQSGDRYSTDLFVDELFSPFVNNGFSDKNQLSKLNFKFLLQIYKTLSQYGINGEGLLGEEFLLYRRLNGCESAEATIQMFKDIFNVCFDAIAALKEKTTNKQIEKAKEYISENYRRDITQLDVAEHIHLNMSYFSRLFKQETGENFVNYLCNYRVDKAIELLKEGVYKSNKVSHMVGYNNEKYFYKIFKKKTGFTPGEVRNK